jgi:hypothetical protein
MRTAKFGDLRLLNGLVLLRIAVLLALVDRVIRLKRQILIIDDKDKLARRSSSTGKFFRIWESNRAACVSPLSGKFCTMRASASQWSYELCL